MEKQKINPEGYVKPPAPYSNVIKMSGVKDMVFLSGVSATNEKGELVCQGDILGQTKQIARNILAELDAVGMGREQIAMTTTYVLGDHLQDFMKTGACSVLFEELDNPADTLVGVAALAGMPYGALIEVGVIAVTA
ncbi:MAG: RidA family protein [Parasporobacterium sp.]|nr:RidA family protein [Parasporobacterium sp.]